MWSAFPTSDYYGGSAPSRSPQGACSSSLRASGPARFPRSDSTASPTVGLRFARGGGSSPVPEWRLPAARVAVSQSRGTWKSPAPTSVALLPCRKCVMLDRAYIRGFAFADQFTACAAAAVAASRVTGASSPSWADKTPAGIRSANYSNPGASPPRPCGFCLTTFRNIVARALGGLLCYRLRDGQT